MRQGFALIFLISLCQIGCGRFASQQIRPSREGVVLLKMKSSLAPEKKQELDALLTKYGLVPEAGKTNPHFASYIRSGAVAYSSITEFEMSQEIIKTGAVVYAEPDYYEYLSATPNEAKFTYSESNAREYLHHLWRIHAPEAWNRETGSPTLKVGICDTSLDRNHPDLKDNLSDISRNWEPDDDTATHATGVAGVLGAVGNNSEGITGVAWKIQLISGVVFDNQGRASVSDVAACINWLGDQGARVVNYSGGSATGGATSYFITDAATRLFYQKNGLLVKSAGNSSMKLYEYNAPDFIMVGATGYDSNLLTDFSNYGSTLDLVAPGDDIYLPTRDGGYTKNRGTSFASPIVAGVAALIFSVNPNFTAAQVRDILLDSATSIDSEQTDTSLQPGDLGRGMVNADAAVQLAFARAPAADSRPIAKISVAENVPLGEAPFYAQLSGYMSSDLAGYITEYTWDFADGSAQVVSASPNVEHLFTDLGIYNVRLVIKDNLGKTGTVVKPIHVIQATEDKKIFIQSIELMLVDLGNGYSQLKARVKIKDFAGNLVSSAPVDYTLRGITASSSQLNNSNVNFVNVWPLISNSWLATNGRLFKFEVNNVKKGIYNKPTPEFNMEFSHWFYHPERNVESAKSIWLGVVPADTDADGVHDGIDNCPLAVNPTQYNADTDNYGNACDADYNNDGYVGSADFSIFKSQYLTSAATNPNFNPAVDFNGDGVVGSADFSFFKSRYLTAQ